MYLIKIVNGFVVSLLCITSGFAAFDDPFRAQVQSGIWSARHPGFPVENIGYLNCSRPDEIPTFAGCFFINNKFALSSAHTSGILNPESKIFAINKICDLKYSKRGIIDFDGNFPFLYESGKAQEVKKVHILDAIKQEKISALSFPDKKYSTNDIFLPKIIAEQILSKHIHEIKMRNGDVITTEHDLVLVELNHALEGVLDFDLKPTPNTLEPSLVYGMAFIQSWTFYTGEKAFQGEVPKKVTEEKEKLKLTSPELKSPILKSPTFLKMTPEGERFNAVLKQLYCQTVYGVPDRPKCFSLFVKKDPENDESFISQASSEFNPTIKQEETDFFGPFVGGMSGSPIFDKDFQLRGFVSETINIKTKGKKLPLTINVFQTLTPAITEKIHQIIKENA